MKIETTMKRIVSMYSKVFRVGYCDLQYIFNGIDPMYYNAGVYGWNCDIYIDHKRDIAITTGYRNMRGKCIPSDILKKYSKIAEDLIREYRWSNYAEIRAKLDENRENFLAELDSL